MHTQPTSASRYDQLAALAQLPTNSYSCRDLTDFMRFATQLNDRGVTGDRLRELHRHYARRLDQLGADEFDRLALIGE